MSATRDIESIADAAARWVARRDAGLSAAEQSDLARWLSADPRHAAALEHYAKMWSSFDRPRRTGATDAVVSAVKARGKRRQRQRLAMAGTALVLLLSTGIFWKTHTPAIPDAIAAGSAVVLSPETRHLPDGSVAQLKAGAVLTVDYRPDVRRIVLEKGEAHFQVAKSPARPFIVFASGVEVRAVGTAFSVQLGTKQVEVLVTEGRVAVDRIQPGATGETDTPSGLTVTPRTLTVLGAGDQLVVDLEGAATPPVPQALQTADMNERLAWRAPRVEFSGTPLAEAVALMNSAGARDGVHQIRLKIDSSARALAAEPVSGIFRADNSEAFVRTLELSLGIQADRQGDEIVLRKAQ